MLLTGKKRWILRRFWACIQLYTKFSTAPHLESLKLTFLHNLAVGTVELFPPYNSTTLKSLPIRPYCHPELVSGPQGRGKLAQNLKNSFHTGEMLKQVQHDGLFVVTLNLVQGRKGGKISLNLRKMRYCQLCSFNPYFLHKYLLTFLPSLNVNAQRQCFSFENCQNGNIRKLENEKDN